MDSEHTVVCPADKQNLLIPTEGSNGYHREDVLYRQVRIDHPNLAVNTSQRSQPPMIRLGICNELFEGWDFAEVCWTVKAARLRGARDRPVHPGPADRRRHARGGAS